VPAFSPLHAGTDSPVALNDVMRVTGNDNTSKTGHGFIMTKKPCDISLVRHRNSEERRAACLAASA